MVKRKNWEIEKHRRCDIIFLQRRRVVDNVAPTMLKDILETIV